MTQSIHAIVFDLGNVLIGWDAHLLALAQGFLPGLVPGLLRAAYARFAPDGRWGAR